MDITTLATGILTAAPITGAIWLALTAFRHWRFNRCVHDRLIRYTVIDHTASFVR